MSLAFHIVAVLAVAIVFPAHHLKPSNDAYYYYRSELEPHPNARITQIHVKLHEMDIGRFSDDYSGESEVTYYTEGGRKYETSEENITDRQIFMRLGLKFQERYRHDEEEKGTQ